MSGSDAIGEHRSIRQDTRRPTRHGVDYRIANRKTAQGIPPPYGCAKHSNCPRRTRADPARNTAGATLDQSPPTAHPITLTGTAVTSGQHDLADRPTNRRRPLGHRRRRGFACECDVRAIRTRIGRKTAGRELRLKFRHERGQGLGRRRGRAPQHARPREMSDPIELEIESGGSNPIRSPLRTTEHIGSERAEEGKRQMKVARVGCPCTDG